MDNAKVNIAVFIDLKKAFDTVDGNILLKKMKFYGIYEKVVLVSLIPFK